MHGHDRGALHFHPNRIDIWLSFIYLVFRNGREVLACGRICPNPKLKIRIVNVCHKTWFAWMKLSYRQLRMRRRVLKSRLSFHLDIFSVRYGVFLEGAHVRFRLWYVMPIGHGALVQ